MISPSSNFFRVSISNGTPVATTSAINDSLVVSEVIDNFVCAKIGPWSMSASRSMMEMPVSVSPAAMADCMGEGPRYLGKSDG